MRVAPKRVNCILVIYNTFLYAYMPTCPIHMPQLIEILRSVTNGPQINIPDILNKLLTKVRNKIKRPKTI